MLVPSAKGHVPKPQVEDRQVSKGWVAEAEHKAVSGNQALEDILPLIAQLWNVGLPSP